MANYYANGPISVPLNVAGLKPDVDLGGLKFSYDHGVFFDPVIETFPLQLPPMWPGGRIWTGQ